MLKYDDVLALFTRSTAALFIAEKIHGFSVSYHFSSAHDAHPQVEIALNNMNHPELIQARNSWDFLYHGSNHFRPPGIHMTMLYCEVDHTGFMHVVIL
jgi:hypothetical protein